MPDEAATGMGRDGNGPGISERLRVPLYHQIYLVLRDKIVTGMWPDGRRLPNEDDLSAQFGVSRITVRRALDDLSTEGLVQRRRGRHSCHHALVRPALGHAVQRLAPHGLGRQPLGTRQLEQVRHAPVRAAVQHPQFLHALRVPFQRLPDRVQPPGQLRRAHRVRARRPRRPGRTCSGSSASSKSILRSSRLTRSNRTRSRSLRR